MRSIILINILIIISSSFAVSFYLFSFDVRSRFSNRPLMGLLVIILSYSIAHFSVIFSKNKYKQLPNLPALIFVSLLGSFIFSIYILVHTLILSLQDSSSIIISNYYAPTVFVFTTISIIFFVISSIILTSAKTIINLRG